MTALNYVSLDQNLAQNRSYKTHNQGCTKGFSCSGRVSFDSVVLWALRGQEPSGSASTPSVFGGWCLLARGPARDGKALSASSTNLCRILFLATSWSRTARIQITVLHDCLPQLQHWVKSLWWWRVGGLKPSWGKRTVQQQHVPCDLYISIFWITDASMCKQHVTGGASFYFSIYIHES